MSPSVLAQLEVLYTTLPQLECKRLCQDSCGPILMGSVEYLRLLSVSGARDLASEPKTLRCPLLAQGSCRVYRVRPMICRLWGLTKSMACPYGCEPQRWLSDTEAQALLGASYRLGGGPVCGIVPDDVTERHAASRAIAARLPEARARLVTEARDLA